MEDSENKRPIDIIREMNPGSFIPTGQKLADLFKKEEADKMMEVTQIPPIVDPTQKVDYSLVIVPTNYVCHKCRATGVKLWREYNALLDHQSLFCCKCSGEEQNKDVKNIDDRGRIESEFGGRTDQIGWRIPAVPTKDNDTYWGYTSVPQDGVEWWKRLPNVV